MFHIVLSSSLCCFDGSLEGILVLLAGNELVKLVERIGLQGIVNGHVEQGLVGIDGHLTIVVEHQVVHCNPVGRHLCLGTAYNAQTQLHVATGMDEGELEVFGHIVACGHVGLVSLTVGRSLSEELNVVGQSVRIVSIAGTALVVGDDVHSQHVLT